MGQKEISILSKILQIIKNKNYEEDDNLSVKLSRLYSNSLSKEGFLKEARKIKTSFFRRNRIKKEDFLTEVLTKLSKETFLDENKFPKPIFIDDVTNFSKVKDFKKGKGEYLNILEKDVKNLIKKIIGEHREQKDWGGEQSDLFTTNLIINKKRLISAICLKGRGKKGVLEISDCGKNGDQIIRLFKEPANLFIFQYVGEISHQVYDFMETCAYKKSEGGIKEIYYCLINGSDTKRLIDAYKEK